MKLGDHIGIHGGYDHDSPLRTLGILWGRVVSFVPGYEPSTLAAVVRLDSPISWNGITGDIVVMELRYEGASWEKEGEPGSQTVGLDLYMTVPEKSMAAQFPPKGWTGLESHAVFEVIDDIPAA